MANNNISSPGIYFNETDQSFIPQGVIEAGAAIIGPTVKGPVERPTLVTSYNDYVSKFGDILISGSGTFSYFTSTAAYDYFNNGGTTLLVTRVASGSFTSATQNVLNGGTASGTLLTGVNVLLGSITQQPSGAANTYTGVEVLSGGNVTASITLDTNQSVSSIQVTEQAGTFSVGDVITFPSSSLMGAGAGQVGTESLSYFIYFIFVYYKYVVTTREIKSPAEAGLSLP